MQIKKRLHINVAVSVIAAGIIIAMMATAVYSVQNAVKESNIADEILTSIYQRSEFRNDYLRSPGERAQVQWFSKHEQIGLLLKSAAHEFGDAEDKAVLERMTKDQESIGKLISSIAENRERPRADALLSREIEDRLTSQLTMRRYNAILDARRLQESAARRLLFSVKLAGWGILGVLIVLTAAAIINSWSMTRVITHRIDALRNGVSIVGKGNLEHRIDIKGKDEFAELSKAFNAMTGKLRGSYVSLEKEIAERRRSEEALQAAFERYRSFVEITGQLGWTTNADGEVMEDLLEWRKYTGQSYDDIKGWGWTKALHPDDIARADEAWRKAVAEKGQYEAEYRIRSCDGLYRHFLARGRPVFEEDGTVREWVGTCIDVTERKKVEELRQSTAYHRSLLEASLDPLVTIDANGKITDANNAAEHATGVPRERLIGSDFSDYFTEPDKARQGYRKVFTEGFVRDYPLAIRHTSGRITHVLYNAVVYKDEAGKAQGVFAAARDITERRRAEEEIQKLNRELEARVIERTAQLENSNRELEAFAYSVSHDLRSPLRSIEGFSLALLEDYAGKLDDAGKSYLSRVRNATMRMGHLIDDLLKLSRVTRSEMNREQVDLSTIVRTIADDLKNRYPERPAQFIIAEGLTAYCDERLLTVAMENLLSNAWKFSEKAPRTVIEFGATEKNGIRYFFVKDNGTGFDMNYAGKLFNPFQRLHKTEEFPGTGIGLATVKRIINRHGGQVWIEAGEGKGATVYFTLA